MLIVVEGPEKSGKSTLIGQIIRLWKGDAVRMYHPAAANNFERFRKDMMFVRTHPDWLVLYDRWYPSDFVYREFDGKPRGTGAYSLEWLDEKWGSRADLKIFCDAPAYVLANRRQADQDPSDFPVDAAKELQQYHKVCPKENGWIWLDGYHRQAEALPGVWQMMLSKYPEVEAQWKW